MVGEGLLLRGLGMTLGLTVIIAGVALPLGLGVATARLRGPVWLGRLLAVAVELLRSIPLILFLALIHFGVMPLLVERPNFVSSTVLAFWLFEAAYFSEIFRGGLLAVKPEEHEAAASLGLSPWQQYRLVVWPLALRRVWPSVVNQTVTLLKDTSLASIVGVIELTRSGEILYEQTFQDFEVLLVVSALYFALSIGVQALFMRGFAVKDSAESPELT
jgi:His/Glu/Gln/Arg/opine family amino acid ABC transporter permease subunit